MPDYDVVVVGAGVAGLTAARDLILGGLSVVVLEAAAEVGGKVRGHEVADVELDAGAESFARRGGTVEKLLRELGLGDDIVEPDSSGAWLHQAGGTAHPLPRTGVLGIPGTPMAADVLAIAGLAGCLRAQLDALIPGFVGSRETMLGPLVRKRMGRRMLDRLVAPVAGGVHSRHPDELEVDAVAPGLRSALRQNESLAKAVLQLRAAAPPGSAVGGVRGGVHRLASELHRDIVAFGGEVRRQCPVRDIIAGGVTTATGERITARRVLTSATAPAPAEITLVTLVIEHPDLDGAPRGTGVLVEAGSRVTAKALTHATAKWDWLAQVAGPGQHVLRLSYRTSELGAESVSEVARADAEALLGVGVPRSSVRAWARVDWAAPARATDAPAGVVQIGESVAGTGLAAVISHARERAAHLLSELAETGGRREDDGEHDNESGRNRP